MQANRIDKNLIISIAGHVALLGALFFLVPYDPPPPPTEEAIEVSFEGDHSGEASKEGDKTAKSQANGPKVEKIGLKSRPQTIAENAISDTDKPDQATPAPSTQKSDDHAAVQTSAPPPPPKAEQTAEPVLKQSAQPPTPPVREVAKLEPPPPVPTPPQKAPAAARDDPPDAEVVTPRPPPRPADPPAQMTPPPTPPAKHLRPNPPTPPAVPTTAETAPKPPPKPPAPKENPFAKVLAQTAETNGKSEPKTVTGKGNGILSSQPRFDSSKALSDLSKSGQHAALEGNRLNDQSGSGVPNGKGQSSLSGSDMEGFGTIVSEHYTQCWIRSGIPHLTDYVPLFQITWAPDGSIMGMPQLVNKPRNEQERVISDSALRALRSCSPLPVPEKFRNHYNEWKDGGLNMKSDSHD